MTENTTTEPNEETYLDVGLSTRLYRTTQAVCFFDSETHDFSKTKFSWDRPTKICIDEKTIGFASLYFDGNKLMASMAIDYASEERLLAETQEIKLYPQVHSFLQYGSKLLNDFSQKVPVLSVEVQRIMLSREKPIDARIVSFGSVDL